VTAPRADAQHHNAPGRDLTQPDAWGNAFTWDLRVYWEDTDAGGIVFYANYLKFFERARTEWLRSLGLGQQHLRETTGGQFVVSEVQLRYLQSARLDDRLRVSAQAVETGKASITLAQTAWRLPDAQHGLAGQAPLPLCTGHIRIGWVNTDTLRPQRMPSQVLNLLAATPIA